MAFLLTEGRVYGLVWLPVAWHSSILLSSGVGVTTGVGVAQAVTVKVPLSWFCQPPWDFGDWNR
jgi:hypothetical protein